MSSSSWLLRGCRRVHGVLCTAYGKAIIIDVLRARLRPMAARSRSWLAMNAVCAPPLRGASTASYDLPVLSVRSDNGPRSALSSQGRGSAAAAAAFHAQRIEHKKKTIFVPTSVYESTFEQRLLLLYVRNGRVVNRMFLVILPPAPGRAGVKQAVKQSKAGLCRQELPRGSM